MKLTTIIVDNEAHAVAVVADYIRRTPDLILQGSFTDPVNALKILNGDAPPVLTFLDIDMPGLSGLDLASLVKGKTIIIFITSHREYGPEAFELSAGDYLLKPISYPRFLKCIQKVQTATEAHSKRNDEFIYVKGDLKGKLLKVNLNEILYIKSDLHYVDIFLTNERITTYLTLAELMTELPMKDFCRVHRSYILNLKKVSAIEQGQIRLENKELIPIGRAYRDGFFNHINPALVINQRDRAL